jgi:hypothetical protein
MKTTNHFFKLKQPLCESVLSNLLYSLWQLPQPGIVYGLALTRKFLQWIAPVFKEVHAGLVALMMAATVNRRIYVGLMVMFVGAPLSYCWYALFEGAPRIPGWFHVNLYHLLFLIRFQIAFAVFFIGLYHYLPQDRRTKLLSIPLGFLFMSIVVNIMAKSNDDIHRIANLSIWAAGVCLSLVLFFGLDYFVWRKFHRADAFEKRLDGIAEIANDLPAEKVVSMFTTTWRERKEFKAKA